MNIKNFYQKRLNELLLEDNNSPEHHMRLATTFLKLGDFRNGFTEYEWRWKAKDLWHDEEYPQFNLHKWGGQKVDKLFVFAEQGFGDTIQFCRYLNLIHNVNEVYFYCQEPLRSLMDHFIATRNIKYCNEVPKDIKYQVPLMSLPYHTRSLPNDIPYFKFDLTNNGKIGYCYRSRHFSEKIVDRWSHFAFKKSIPSEFFVELSKQYDMIEISADSFIDLANMLSGLDLIITCDTAVAHLSASMGKETWILLPVIACWRWMLNTDESIWYPGNVKLFRQDNFFDWSKVFEVVQSNLGKRYANQR